jgi:hypothetical protein
MTSLIRLKPGELPVGVPLPWPVFGKNGAMLLSTGGVIPMEDAQDLLKAGLFRSRGEAAPMPGRDLTQRYAGAKPELPGLSSQVESIQIGMLEDGSKERSLFRVEYLGRIPDTSLIISQPQREGRLVPICVGQTVGVNMVVGCYVHAFSAQILCAQKLPAPHIHLAHPETFKSSTLRSSKRVSLQFSILALLRMGEELSIPVSIIDLSSKGLALLSEYPLGDPGTEVQLSFSVQAGEVPLTIRTSGIIRSGRPIKAQQVYRYGVELTDLTPEQRIAIQAFIYQHL